MNPADYGDVYNSLQGQYQPQQQQVQSQIDALPGQQQAQMSALDQAKVNAFKDITNQANSRGVIFSGVPIDQQATYTGTKYLPAVANLQTSFNNTKNTLLGQINTLQAGRQKQAQDSVSAYQKAQAEEAYRQQQLGLGYARLSVSQQNAANRGSGNTAAQTRANLAQYKSGSYKSGNQWYSGPGGAPLSAASYAQATGTGLLDLLRQSGSAYDKKAYNDAQTWLKKGGEDFAIQNLQKKYGALF